MDDHFYKQKGAQGAHTTGSMGYPSTNQTYRGWTESCITFNPRGTMFAGIYVGDSS